MVPKAAVYHQNGSRVSLAPCCGGHAMPGHDAFPSTLVTWISDRQVEGEDGRQRINRHVMTVYGEPLLIYLRGHSLRWLGEPQEMVDDFFADRLGRADFFDKWRDSGLRLRRWLMNGLNLYLMEERRRHQQSARAGPAELYEDPGTCADSPEKALDRAFAQSIVKQALQGGQQHCESKGLGEHWRIFVRHYYDGQQYDELAADFGVEPARAAVMARTAARVFRSAIRELLAGDGAAPNQLDSEIQSLLEDIQG